MIRSALVAGALLVHPCNAAQLRLGGSEALSPTSPREIAINVHQVARADRAPLAYEAPSGHIIFRVIIAGKEGWGLLDSGASYSLIDSDLARASGLGSTIEDKTMQTPAGAMPLARVDPVSVLLPGQMTLKYERLRATDLRALGLPARRRVDFVLGQDLLDSFFVIVDPDKQTLVFAPSGSFKPSAQFRPIALKDGKPQLEMKVDCKPLIVTIDTGKDDDLDLQPGLWGRFVPVNLPVRKASAMAANGKLLPTRRAVLPRASIGAISLAHVKVAERSLPPSWGDGSIGMGILSRFRFVLDIHARTLWVAPRAGVQAASLSPAIDACASKE